MTNDVILAQLVQTVLPKLINRVKELEASVNTVEGHYNELIAKYEELSKQLSEQSAPKRRTRARKKAYEEPVITPEEEAKANSEMAAASDPLDLTPDELGYFDALIRQGITDPTFVANAYGIDKEKFASYIASVGNVPEQEPARLVEVEA